jgi:hypothetical protein
MSVIALYAVLREESAASPACQGSVGEAWNGSVRPMGAGSSPFAPAISIAMILQTSKLADRQCIMALLASRILRVNPESQVDHQTRLRGMICEAALASPPVAPLPLGSTDLPEMLDLTAATEPGQFLPQTIQMGSYFEIRASDGRLVAMAGERLQSTAFAEISAVCTLPEFRGWDMRGPS